MLIEVCQPGVLHRADPRALVSGQPCNRGKDKEAW